MYRLIAKGQIVDQQAELAALDYTLVQDTLSWCVEHRRRDGTRQPLAYVELGTGAFALNGKETCAWATNLVRDELLTRDRLSAVQDYKTLFVGECWRGAPALPYVSPREHTQFGGYSPPAGPLRWALRYE